MIVATRSWERCGMEVTVDILDSDLELVEQENLDGIDRGMMIYLSSRGYFRRPDKWVDIYVNMRTGIWHSRGEVDGVRVTVTKAARKAY